MVASKLSLAPHNHFVNSILCVICLLVGFSMLLRLGAKMIPFGSSRFTPYTWCNWVFHCRNSNPFFLLSVPLMAACKRSLNTDFKS